MREINAIFNIKRVIKKIDGIIPSSNWRNKGNTILKVFLS